jgi:hypothetical protein
MSRVPEKNLKTMHCIVLYCIVLKLTRPGLRLSAGSE